MKKGQIFFIMWVSGAWKWTLINNLKKQKEIDLTFLKSYVTREIRNWEVNWNIYNFISKEEFEASIKAWEFLEYKLVHKLNYYGTKKAEIIDNWINKGEKIVKEIEIEWLKDILSNNPNLKKYITTIFLDIPKETLVERIETRWDNITQKELENRLISLENEKKGSKEFCDHIVNTSNISKEETLQFVLNIIKNK